jgi:ribose transport system substrate-binding protein
MDQRRKGRIGLFVISDRTGYQRLLIEDGVRAAQRFGLEVEVFSADDTAALQSAQIVKFLHAHPGPEERLAVVAMPVSDIGHEQALENLGRKVLKRGAGWMMLNRDVLDHVERLRPEFPDLPIGLVAHDNLEVGRIQGRQVRSVLNGKANVLYVLGNVQTSAARDRRAGFLEMVTPPVTVTEVEGMWSAESGEKVVARWLATAVTNDAPVDVVAGQNDPMAVGARQALHRVSRERNRPEWLKVPVFGVDGLPGEGQRWVDEKTLCATVAVPPTSGPAIELVARFWQSQAPIPAKVVLDPKPYPVRVAGR